MIIGPYEETVEIIPEEEPVPKPRGEDLPPPVQIENEDEEGIWAS